MDWYLNRRHAITWPFDGRVYRRTNMTHVLMNLVNDIYDVIKWKRFPRYWPYVKGIHR